MIRTTLEVPGDTVKQDRDQMFFYGQFLIDEPSDNDTVKNGYCTALGRCEHSETHSENNAKREKQSPEGGNFPVLRFLSETGIFHGSVG